MLRSIFSRGDAPPAAPSTRGDQPKPAVLLVLQADSYDWPVIFADAKLADGRRVEVVQTGWEDIQVHVSTYSSANLCVEVAKPAASATDSARYPRTVQPDFLLVRNEVCTPTFDGRDRLEGFLFADLPASNSLSSIWMQCSRPAMQGQLHALNKRLGDAFKVVPQHFASSSRALMYGYTFPAVVKVGSAHAGAGKMKIQDHRQMSDFRSVLQMMPEHCTVEPFIPGVGDLRIQKIGTHHRAFRRCALSGEWKTNTGTSAIEEVPVEDRWRVWADEAAALFGGLDICTVDAIVEESGAEWILEVNGTSSGLFPDCAEEDNRYIRDIVLGRMNEALCAS